MTTEDWGTFLIYAAVPAATLFPILYMTTAPWYRSWAGRAIVVSKIGLAVLVWASLLFRILGHDYPYRADLTLTAFALIVVGTWLYLFAFIREQYLHRRA